jgi:hypothetical protein
MPSVSSHFRALRQVSQFLMPYTVITLRLHWFFTPYQAVGTQ